MGAKIHYDAATGTELVIYPDDIAYEAIVEPYIVVDQLTMQDVFDNRDCRKVDLQTLQLVACEPPLPALNEVKAAKWNEIKAERDRRERAGFAYLGKLFDSDLTSAQRIALAAQAAQLALAAGDKDFSIDWTLADNAQLSLSAEQVCGMAVALAHNSNVLHQTARKLREQISEAHTTADVEKMVWPSDAQ